MMSQSKDPFEVAFEEQDESPPESPANSLPEYQVRDAQKQSVANHQLTSINVQDDDNYDEDDDNEIDNDDGDPVIDRPPESTMVASSSMQVSAGNTAAAVRGKNKDDDEEELEEDNMDVELGKLQSTGDPDKMAKMQ